MKRRQWMIASISLLTSGLVATGLSRTGNAQNNSQRPLIFSDKGIAIQGTDPVAYFTERKPVKGNPAFAHQWKGVTWHFASTINRDLFKADPEKYAPQFGGYCAWAVANKYTAATVPEAWSIVDGKLYLNFNLGIRSRWEKDIPGNITKANANWPAALQDYR